MTDVDTVGQLIQAFRAVEPRSDSARKLDVLLDLERLDDPRALPFLLGVLRDSDEPEPVRIDVLTRLRDAPLGEGEHRCIGRAIGELLVAESSCMGLRLQAALVLGKFTDVDGVVDTLGVVLMDASEPAELRYNAFTSLYLGGPTAESLKLLHGLCGDETLGRCAESLLSAWRSTAEVATR